MNSEALTIISADCHAGAEHMVGYRTHLDPAYRNDFEDYCSAIQAFDSAYGEGFTAGGATSAGEEGLWDAEVRTHCLDADGVAAEVIHAQGSVPFGQYPAVGGGRRLNYTATAAQLAAGCRAYNRWLAELCAHDTRRHLGIARVPLPDVGAAVKEVEYAASLGLRGGIALPPLSSQTAIPFFNDPIYEPLWSACEAHGMVLNMHGGSGLAYNEGPGSSQINLAEVDWFSHRGLSHLIFGGVFERHANLHLAITEQRTHWLQPLLKEFDSIHEFTNRHRFGNGGGLPKKPSEYFLSNCFIGASFMSRLECEARGEIGAACFMWGSDYPHNEGAWPYTGEALRYTFGDGVPTGEVAAMLGGNAMRCYYLDATELHFVAKRIGPTLAEMNVPIEVLPGEAPGDAPNRSWAFRRNGPWH
jgi:predicted TIM-barrel fold metal-dependent hydrolase